ncbi:MAG TPA: cysteine desulfurase family protein [Hyphomicrobiaceae bacterium]|nr:cysteine desulfurase family protein [Hyphomicrobiaceae bacterium]
MSRTRTYLDHNATAPLRPEARQAMLGALDVVGNPSSPHAEGRRARAIVEDAREAVAALVGARPAEVVFTSGGTEANNAVLAGGWKAILLSGVEHDSVLAPARASGARLVELPVGRDGVVDAEAAAAAMQDGGGRTLLSLQLANNETGVTQPVAEVALAARAHGLAVHSDAVQAAGRIPVDLALLGVDYLTLSAHKLGGPKGVGALIVRERAPALPGLIAGGGQERRRRAGTENVAGIAGFGAAAAAASADLARMGRVRALRDLLEREVRRITPEAVIVAEAAERLPNTTSLALPGASAETLVIALDLKGVAVSAGAACSSGKVGASHVLEAMGLAPPVARAAIRVSLGPGSGERDIESFLEAWSELALARRARAVA